MRLQGDNTDTMNTDGLKNDRWGFLSLPWLCLRPPGQDARSPSVDSVLQLPNRMEANTRGQCKRAGQREGLLTVIIGSRCHYYYYYLEKAVKIKERGRSAEAEEFRGRSFASPIPAPKGRARAKKKGPMSFILSTHLLRPNLVLDAKERERGPTWTLSRRGSNSSGCPYPSPCSCPQHCHTNQSPSPILRPKYHWIPRSPDLSSGLSISSLGLPTHLR